jgi:hypothetical protein
MSGQKPTVNPTVVLVISNITVSGETTIVNNTIRHHGNTVGNGGQHIPSI